MKVIAGLLSLMAIVLSPSQVVAQHIATIGIGDITYSAKNRLVERSPESVLSALNTGINRDLVSTRKFSTLEYPELISRLDRQGRTLEGYYAKSYTGNAVTQVGLDYILTANVVEFGLSKQESGSVEKSVGVLELDFELIGVSDVTNGFDSSLIARHSATVRLGSEASTEEALDGAIQRALDQLVDQVVSNLFPIRVMKIDDSGVVMLNYGAGLLEQGDAVFIYPKGVDIVIDKAGKPAEGSVATLQITSSERKFAMAQIVNGYRELEKGQKGKLLQRGR